MLDKLLLLVKIYRLINTETRSKRLEHLRISHETLCRASRMMGDCFGVPVLIVCVSSLLSVTCALYTGALRMGVFNLDHNQNTNDNFDKIGGFYILSIVQGLIALLVLTLILLSGQIVRNMVRK
jgi:hypothetical protein